MNAKTKERRIVTHKSYLDGNLTLTTERTRTVYRRLDGSEFVRDKHNRVELTDGIVRYDIRSLKVGSAW